MGCVCNNNGNNIHNKYIFKVSTYPFRQGYLCSHSYYYSNVHNYHLFTLITTQIKEILKQMLQNLYKLHSETNQNIQLY